MAIKQASFSSSSFCFINFVVKCDLDMFLCNFGFGGNYDTMVKFLREVLSIA